MIVAADPSRRMLDHSGAPRPEAAATLDTVVTAWSSPAGSARAGGDWCDTLVLSDSRLALTIGDVSGHGEEVAGTRAIVHASIVSAIYDIRVPSDVLCVANGLAFSLGDGVVVTAIVAVFDRHLRTLTFANAGHPPPLMLTPNGHAFLTHSPADLPLGLFPHHSAADYVVAVPPDALVLFYTDGITEHAHDPIGGERELVEAARVVHARPAVNAARGAARRVLKNGRGDDDAAAIGLRTLPLSI